MGVPIFQSAAARGSVTSTTITPAMPASIAAGDFLIAFCSVSATGITFAAISGWNVGDLNNTNNITGTWYWRVATGSDPAPVFSWTGAHNAAAQVGRFTGTAASPIGNFINNSATASTTI